MANSLVVYFSNDLEDSVLIEIADENGNYTELNTITGTYTCESNLDTEYPDDIRFEFALNGTSKVSKVRFTILTQSDYPEIDAVGLVKPAIATKVGQSPIVIGNPKVGEYLGAVTNDDTWTGSPKPVVTYQWFACTKAGTRTATAKPADCTAITGATRIFIKLKAAQKGKYLRIRVTGTNPGATKSIYSKSTAKVK